MTKLTELQTSDLLWMAAGIQADIVAHQSGGKVQHPQYSLDNCRYQLAQVEMELKRRGFIHEGDYLRHSVAEMLKESFNELAKEANHDDA
jgi:hypothetical protein